MRCKSMKRKNQSGFSLIELLLVLVIISVLATITFPFLYRARGAAENGNAIATMRTTSSAQVSYFSQNGRFARLSELNNAQGGGLGTIAGSDMLRGKFTFQMLPITPSDEQLRDGYTIVATKAIGGNELPCIISLDQTGFITKVITC